MVNTEKMPQTLLPTPDATVYKSIPEQLQSHLGAYLTVVLLNPKRKTEDILDPKEHWIMNLEFYNTKRINQLQVQGMSLTARIVLVRYLSYFKKPRSTSILKNFRHCKQMITIVE